MMEERSYNRSTMVTEDVDSERVEISFVQKEVTIEIPSYFVRMTKKKVMPPGWILQPLVQILLLVKEEEPKVIEEAAENSHTSKC